MRRSASEIINNLETRIARLERQAYHPDDPRSQEMGGYREPAGGEWHEPEILTGKKFLRWLQNDREIKSHLNKSVFIDVSSSTITFDTSWWSKYTRNGNTLDGILYSIWDNPMLGRDWKIRGRNVTIKGLWGDLVYGEGDIYAQETFTIKKSRGSIVLKA
jgi:hypothetical protein